MAIDWGTYISDPESNQIGSPTASANTLTGKAKPKFWGSGVIGALSDVGLGAGKKIIQTGLGLGKAAVNIVGGIEGALGQKSAQKYAGQVSSTIGKGQEFFNTPETNTMSGKVGGVLGDVAMLSDPGLAIKSKALQTTIKGSSAMSALKAAPGALKPLSYTAQKVLTSIPSMMTGTVYGASQGQSAKKSLQTGLEFGVLDSVGQMFGDAWGAIKGDLTKNIERVFKAVTPKEQAKAISAMKSYNQLADEITVGTGDASHVFNPGKATVGEMFQATPQVKTKLFQTYSEMAQRAGDKGASFTPEDWKTVISDISSMKKNATSDTKNAVDSLIKDIRTNYGKDEFTQFENVDEFLQQLNRSDPFSGAAKGETAGRASRTIRGIIDRKIEATTGEKYQAVRNQYAAVKSVEKRLEQLAKKAAAKGGSQMSGMSRMMERFGTVDAIAGLLTHGTSEMIRGLGLIGTSEIASFLKSDSTALRTIFNYLNSAGKVAGPSAIGTLGKSTLQTGITAINNPSDQVGSPIQ